MSSQVPVFDTEGHFVTTVPFVNRPTLYMEPRPPAQFRGWGPPPAPRRFRAQRMAGGDWELTVYVEEGTNLDDPHVTGNIFRVLLDHGASEIIYGETAAPPEDSEDDPEEELRKALTEILHQRHEPVPGERTWQRNHQTKKLESTCVCGEVLAIEEKYTTVTTSWATTRNLDGAGKAWYEHRDAKRMEALMALFTTHQLSGKD